MNSNVLGLRNNSVSTRNDNTNNNYSLGFIKYNDNRQQIILYNTDLNYNPSTQTLNVPNISASIVGGISTINITDTGDDTDYYLVFTNSAGLGKTLRVNETASIPDTFTYNPSTNKLSVLRVYCGYCESENFIGNGSQLTHIQTTALDGVINNGQLQHSFITIGTTPINLGNTTTELFGLTDFKVGTLRITDGAIRDTDGTITFDTTNLVGLGRLGFGPDSVVPEAKLDVGSIDEYFQGIFKNRNATNPGQIIIRNIAHNDQIQIKSKYDADENHIYTTNASGTSNLRLNTSMMLLANGNVGIGTITPNKRLTILTDSDYSEFNLRSNGQEMLFGCQTSGTRCYIQARTIGINNNYLTLNPNGGNVGIGISTPLYKCHVDTDSGSGNYGFIHSSGAVNLGTYISAGTNAYFGTKSNHNLRLMVNDSTKMIIDTSGLVGINLVTPTHQLSIGGSVNAFMSFNPSSYRRFLIGSDEKGFIVYDDITGGSEGYRMVINSIGNVGIGTTTPARKLSLYDGATAYASMNIQGTSANLVIGADSSLGIGYIQPQNAGVLSNLMLCGAGGNVGIGNAPSYKLDIDSGASTYAIRIRNNLDTDGWLFRNIADNKFSIHQENGGDRMTFDNGNVGIGISPDPAYKLEVLGQIKCGTYANSLTALDIDTNSTSPYGMYLGGWSAGGRTNGNATFEMSSNLHIDSPSNGPNGAGNIYLNYFNASQSTYIRNRVDISDKRIKKDIVEIETQEQFTETFEIIKKVGSYKYKYRDTYRENDLDQYGFIAQEVLQHYPVAYKLAGNNCYLPNIMETLNFTYEVGDDNEYTFNIEGYDLDVNIKYIFYGFKEGVEQFDYLENIEPTTNNTFAYTPAVIKNEEPPTYIKLVLVGTYTDDKLGVSKDRLFQLGFAGVRGLITENENMKKEILELKENQKKIIQKLNELINSDGWFKNSI